jgi:hypothetical protein
MLRLGLLPALDLIAVAIAETPNPPLTTIVDAFSRLLSPIRARLFVLQLSAADIVRINDEGRVSLTPLGHRLRAELGNASDVEIEVQTPLETSFDLASAVAAYLLSLRVGNS